MRSRLMVVGLIMLSMLLAACNKAPPGKDASAGSQLDAQRRSDPVLSGPVLDLMERAEAGDADAQYALGSFYQAGFEVPRDPALAIKLYEKAAAQGNADAQVALGLMSFGGEDIPADMAKAAEWFQKAANQGHPIGQAKLGFIYDEGLGVAADSKKAVELYGKAAAQGNVDAKLMLGIKYLWGSDGVPKNATKAEELLHGAAVQHVVLAQSLLGQMYRFGQGVPKDAAKAIEWYGKAAAQGDAEAQFGLGSMYYEGIGVPKDTARTADLWKQAAAQGLIKAQVVLGLEYTNGQIVPKDDVLSYAWLNLAASQGNAVAANARSTVERLMSANEIAEGQRLSSSWKIGQILTREGQIASPDLPPADAAKGLTKQGTGTLFVVNTSGQAITNRHVVDGCSELRVEGRDGLARVMTDDAMNDLALVQIPGEAKASATIASDPGKLRQGEEIVVFGFPLNAVLSSGGNLTPGVVSALTGLGNNTNQIQLTAAIQAGSSGSPVMNKKGEVVGVVSMKVSDAKLAKLTGQVGQSLNFAVNGQTLRSFLNSHQVPYRSGAGFFSRDKSGADLADEARKWTLVMECWK